MSRNTLCAIIVLVSSSTTALKAQQPRSNWVKGPADRFTGNVWVNYIAKDTTTDFLVSQVTFEAKARSNWHYHVGKQIIFAIDGEGYYKEKDKPMRRLKKGDVIVIEPRTVHSHGSINSSKFTQAVMMNGITIKSTTTWLTKLEEEDLK